MKRFTELLNWSWGLQLSIGIAFSCDITKVNGKPHQDGDTKVFLRVRAHKWALWLTHWNTEMGTLWRAGTRHRRKSGNDRRKSGNDRRWQVNMLMAREERSEHALFILGCWLTRAVTCTLTWQTGAEEKAHYLSKGSNPGSPCIADWTMTRCLQWKKKKRHRDKNLYSARQWVCLLGCHVPIR